MAYYQLIKDGYTYDDTFSTLEELVDEALPYSIEIVDLTELKEWIEERSYNLDTLISIYTEMKARQCNELYWLNSNEYFIIPNHWTVESALRCLDIFQSESECAIICG